ncbi:expressed unknown protein [Seminavis robusta]|uniref:NTF2 domain-containing protein n=1 Tax=Seminavis robusta TaxID=568900 RepID=A0A9N8DF43_9STRA|nr:expressed unknown protein [Seminavis robusta]|eukprot:Sro63_g035990.1 n/a (208) ;mRNA; f:107544-108167
MTEDSVRAFLTDYFLDSNSLFGKSRDCWETFYEKNHHPDYTHVRNTGGVWTSKDVINVLSSGVLNGKRLLVSIDNVILLAEGRTAVVTYTIDQIFTFKGVENSDRCVYTLVLAEIDGQPKMVQEQRSNGMPIPEPQSRWKTNADTQGHHNHIADYNYGDEQSSSNASVNHVPSRQSRNDNPKHADPPRKPSARRASARNEGAAASDP